MTSIRRVLLLIAAVGLVAACGGDDSGDDTGADPGTGTSIATTGSTDPTVAPEPTEATAEPSDDETAPSGAVTVSVGDSSWEITEIIECQLGGDGQDPDFRQFVGTTADGETRFTMSYWPEEELAGLSGADLETVVDGNEWNYSYLYSTDGNVDITPTGAGSTGSADVGVVGIDAPEEQFVLEWSISCG